MYYKKSKRRIIYYLEYADVTCDTISILKMYISQKTKSVASYWEVGKLIVTNLKSPVPLSYIQ